MAREGDGVAEGGNEPQPNQQQETQDARTRGAQAGPEKLFMFLQVAVMLLAWNTLSGRLRKGTPTTDPSPTSSLESAPIGRSVPRHLHDGADGVDADLFSSRLVGGAEFRFNGVPGSSEHERVLALDAVPGEATLRPLWAPETRFSLRVYLSESDDTLHGFPSVEDIPGPVVSFARRGNLAEPTSTQDSCTEAAAAAAEAADAGDGSPPDCPSPPQFDGIESSGKWPILLWEEEGLSFDWEPMNTRSAKVQLHLPDSVRNNGTAFAHICLLRDDAHQLLGGWDFSAQVPMGSLFCKVHPLTVHMEPPKINKAVSLLGDSPDEAGAPETRSEHDSAPPPFVAGVDTSNPGDGVSSTTISEASDSAASKSVEESNVHSTQPLAFWKPILPIGLVFDHSTLKRSLLLAHMKDSMVVDPASRTYFPVVYPVDFWILQEDMQPLNLSCPEMQLDISFMTYSMWKWQVQVQMEQTWKTQREFGTSTYRESDSLKRMVMDTNPVLLGITVAVSLLHMVFDMLAFKNDIAFWRSRKSFEGLSVRTIGVNCFFQVVILLYLFDNDTSWMILMSNVIGVMIEFWKLRKTVSISTESREGGGRFAFIPRMKFTWHGQTQQSATKKFDRMAMEHLSYAIFPLVAGYAGYSLIYQKHKSFYSWILSSITGFIYVFGFVLMTPQLFINYKLKSVAALPWRALVYKSLNTFIDDLFAFVIKMPTMHRLSCFRDDLIFFIYMYQRWIYPIDRSRRNEFGVSGEDYDSVGPDGKRLKPSAPGSQPDESNQAITDSPAPPVVATPDAPPAVADAPPAVADAPRSRRRKTDR